MSKEEKLPDAVSGLIAYLAYAFYEEYQTPDEYAEINPDGKGYEGYRFQISGPEDLRLAIERLLIGRVKDVKDSGPKGFEESDTKIIFQVMEEMRATGKSKTELLKKYSEIAERRDFNTEFFSVQERLSKVYDRIEARQGRLSNPSNKIPIILEQFIADGAADDNFRLVTGPLEFLRPWIKKNADEIIKILES